MRTILDNSRKRKLDCPELRGKARRRDIDSIVAWRAVFVERDKCAAVARNGFAHKTNSSVEHCHHMCQSTTFVRERERERERERDIPGRQTMRAAELVITVVVVVVVVVVDWKKTAPSNASRVASRKRSRRRSVVCSNNVSTSTMNTVCATPASSLGVPKPMLLSIVTMQSR